MTSVTRLSRRETADLMRLEVRRASMELYSWALREVRETLTGSLQGGYSSTNESGYNS